MGVFKNEWVHYPSLSGGALGVIVRQRFNRFIFFFFFLFTYIKSGQYSKTRTACIILRTLYSIIMRTTYDTLHFDQLQLHVQREGLRSQFFGMID